MTNRPGLDVEDLSSLLHVLPTVLPASPEPPESSYLTEFRRGELALEEGRYGAAAEAFDVCIRVSPRNSICAFYQACVAAQSGNLEASMTWVERALDWGYEDIRMFEVEPDLSPLHKMPAFESTIDRARQGQRPSTAVDEVELAWSMSLFTAVSSDGSRLIGRNGGVVDIDSEEFMYFPDTGDKGTHAAILGPVGDLLITSNYDKSLVCWDAWSGEFLRRLDEEAGWAQELTLTDDGRYLLCGERVWDTVTGTVRLHLPVSKNAADGTSRIDPRGRFVLTARRGRNGGRAALWNLETGRRLASQKDIGIPGYMLGFDTSGQYAWVIGSRGKRWLTVFELDGTEAIHHEPVEFRGEPILVPLQEGVFASFADRLYLIDLTRSEYWPSLESSPRRWMETAANPSEHPVLEAGGRRWSDGPIFARDLSTGREVWKLTTSLDGLRRSVFTLDTERFLIVRGSELEIRSASDGELLNSAHPFGLSTSEPVLLPADRVVMGDSSGDLTLFDIRQGVSARRLSVESGTQWRPVGTRGSTRVLISRPGAGLALVNVESGEVLHDWPDLVPGSGVLSPDGEHVLARAEELGYVTVASKTGEVLATLGEPEARFGSWSPDGMSIALSSSDAVTMWNAVTGAALGKSLDHPERVWCLAFDASGDRLATGTYSGDVRVWDVDTGELQETFPNSGLTEGGRVAYVEFSPDGSLLVCTGHAGYLWMWSVDEGKRIWEHDYGGGNSAPMYAHFDDEGKRLYVSGQMSFSPRVFDAATGETIANLSGDGVTHLRYVCPGRFVGSGYHSLRVYDERTCDLLYAWIPFAEGQGLTHTRQGYFSSPRGVERKIHLLSKPTSHPLESFAVALYDPKRVRAAVSGVQLRSPELRTPPRLTLLNNQRCRKVADEPISLAATAADPEGIGGFWIEVDGTPIPRGQLAEATEISEDGTSASLDLNWPVNERVTFRLQAVGTTGLLSRSRWITAEPH